MGFVYNNPWEGFCKTYFELHGYFVTTNLFAALLSPDEVDKMQQEGLIENDLDPEAGKKDARNSKIEADLVAYRIPNTDLGYYPLDKSTDTSSPFEFFAGDDKYRQGDKLIDQRLIYAEVRANLSITNPDQQVKKFFAKGKGKTEGKKVERMTEILERRFKMKPLVVVMAFDINAECKKLFKKHGRWKYKEFRTMFGFVEDRMAQMFEVKKRVQYNDPFLELFRYFERVKGQG